MRKNAQLNWKNLNWKLSSSIRKYKIWIMHSKMNEIDSFNSMKDNLAKLKTIREIYIIIVIITGIIITKLVLI